MSSMLLRAAITASLRAVRISWWLYLSRVNFLEYGSYRNAGTDGLAIMMASKWKRPSPRYLFLGRRNTRISGRRDRQRLREMSHMSASTSPRGGAVQPKISPGDRGFDRGIVASYRPVQSLGGSWPLALVTGFSDPDPSSCVASPHSRRPTRGGAPEYSAFN